METLKSTYKESINFYALLAFIALKHVGINGATASGIKVLLKQWGIETTDVAIDFAINEDPRLSRYISKVAFFDGEYKGDQMEARYMYGISENLVGLLKRTIDPEQ